MATRKPAPALAAYVLHSYDWSESSLIVELFTREQGRLVVAAKGAKRPTSNFRPVLLPFHPLSVWLSRGRAEDGEDAEEVRGLRAAQWGGGAPIPAARLMAAFYMNELLLKGLARQDAHPLLFDVYAQALAALAALAALPSAFPLAESEGASAGESEAAVLRAFELVWLRELGWLPELDVATASAQPLKPESRYALHAEGGLGPATEGPLGRTWVALHAALLHGSFAALAHACGGAPAALPARAPAEAPAQRTEAAALRAALRQLVQYHLATPMLRTRRVSQQMQRLVGPAGRARSEAPAGPARQLAQEGRA